MTLEKVAFFSCKQFPKRDSAEFPAAEGMNMSVLTGESEQHTTASTTGTFPLLLPPSEMLSPQIQASLSFSTPSDLYQLSLLSDTFLDHPNQNCITSPPSAFSIPFQIYFSPIALI